MLSWINRNQGVSILFAGLLVLSGVAMGAKISSWASLTGADSASGDLIPVVDISEAADADKNKTFTRDELAVAIAAGFAADAITGSDVTAATDSAEGVVELATDGETATGTATDRAVTPANVTSLSLVTASSTDTLTNKIIIDDSNEVHAEAVFVRVRNITGTTLTRGTVVFASGYNAGQEVVEVAKADADDAAKMPAIGLIESDIATGSNGHVILAGDISAFNTSVFTVLDELYVHTTAGELTATRPTAAGTEVQKIAIVVRDHASLGIVEVFGAQRANDIPNTFSTDYTITSDVIAGSSALYNMSATDSTAGEGLVVPQHATACPASTVAGQLCLEIDVDILHISDGTELRAYLPSGAFSGDATVSATGTVEIQADAVVLATDTSGNFVATIVDAGSTTITVANSGTENAAVTLNVVDLNCTNCIGPTEITDLTLGTDTAGNYVATVAAGTGITIAEGDSEGATKTVVATLGTDIAVSELASGTDGELITWDASGVAATVAVGTSGQVLTSGGVGVAPTFTNAGTGDITDVWNCASGNCEDIALGATDLLDMSATDSTALEGLILPQHATVCPASTVEGQLCWEADADKLWIGDGSALIEIGAGGGGEAAFTAESVPGVTPTATGTDAIAIGDGAVAGDAVGDDGVLAIGARSTATGDGAIAIGENTDATGINSIAIGGSGADGDSADATGARSIAIGFNTLAQGSAGSIAIGDTVTVNTGSIGIGEGAAANNVNVIAIGTNASAGNAAGTIAMGLNSRSFIDNALAIGENTDATGANCIAIGGNTTDADSADCSAANSVAIGQSILADDAGESAYASGKFLVQSDAHISHYVLRIQTTDATLTAMSTDGAAAGSGNDISVPSDCLLGFSIMLIGRQTNADDVGAMYLFEGAIDNNAGTTALLVAVTKTVQHEDEAAWEADVVADDTNDGIDINVTGAAGDNVNWVAQVEIVQSCG